MQQETTMNNWMHTGKCAYRQVQLVKSSFVFIQHHHFNQFIKSFINYSSPHSFTVITKQMCMKRACLLMIITAPLRQLRSTRSHRSRTVADQQEQAKRVEIEEPEKWFSTEEGLEELVCVEYLDWEQHEWQQEERWWYQDTLSSGYTKLASTQE